MNPSLHRHYRRWIAGHGPWGPAVRALLRPASWIYGLGVVGRLGLYRVGLLRRTRLPARVISIGNITAGGTGKTPFVILLVRALRERGVRPAVVVRGYGGKREGETVVVSDGAAIAAGYPEVGDEALLLARKLAGVPILMSADRIGGCRAAIRKFGAGVILLDDGFQHLAVERDLDICLLDGDNPFGYGYLLPRGLLREPLGALGRADLFVLTGAGGARGSSDLPSRLRRTGRVPVLHAVYTPTTLTNVQTGETVAAEQLRGRTVVAFCGIGNPVAFERTLQVLEISPAHHVVFPDHYRYESSDLMEIARRMAEAGATIALTTEKDAIRLEGLRPAFPVFSVGIELTLTTKGEELKRCLDGLFP